ncbi:YybH family protein [Marinibaculum pumilum]|uniref:YybH family protein n=1 Tax=Marinibaculum pumilum TaxID=1766165 RepID=A0ABV7KW25_9PROT
MHGNDDVAALRALIEGWVQALKDKDAAAVVACGASGLTAFTLAPPLVSDSTDATGLQAWFDTWQGGLGYELRDLEIAAGGDLGHAHFLTRLDGTKTDGSDAGLWFRQTLCFRRLEAGWRIVHLHQSVPFYMDGSFRAAVDLMP